MTDFRLTPAEREKLRAALERASSYDHREYCERVVLAEPEDEPWYPERFSSRRQRQSERLGDPWDAEYQS